MKYIDKLINEYKNAIHDYNGGAEGEFCYFNSKYFDYEQFLDEYLEITDISDRYIFLKFISREVNKELQRYIWDLKSSKEMLTKDYVNLPHNIEYKPKILESIENAECHIPELEDLIKKLTSEVNECELILKFKNIDSTKNEKLADEERNVRKIESAKAIENSKINEIVNTTKIKWYGNETTLTYLIECLKENKWITDYNTFANFKNHFCKMDGSEFNFSQAKENYQNSKKGKPKSSDKIDEMVNKLKSKE